MGSSIGQRVQAGDYSPAMDPTAGSLVLTVVASGLVGLVVGSFLNVVIYRVPLGMSVLRPPSHCPACGTQLKPADNVPVVSWLVLRAKCRYCRAPISPRYPTVELATGLAFAGIAWCLGTLRPLPSILVVVAAVLAAAAIDLDGSPIPWSVDVAAGLGALSLVVVAAVAAQPGRIGWAALGGAAAGVAALSADRSDRGARRATAVAALGWSASWLWTAGGLVLAGWVVAVAAGATLVRQMRRSRASGRLGKVGATLGGSSAAEGGKGKSGSAVPLAVVAVGGLGVLLAGAALGGPF